MTKWPRLLYIGPNGGRRWWAHLAFTRLNIDANYPPQKMEDLRQLGAFMFPVAPGPRTTLGGQFDAVELWAGLVTLRRRSGPVCWARARPEPQHPPLRIEV